MGLAAWLDSIAAAVFGGGRHKAPPPAPSSPAPKPTTGGRPPYETAARRYRAVISPNPAHPVQAAPVNNTDAAQLGMVAGVALGAAGVPFAGHIGQGVGAVAEGLGVGPLLDPYQLETPAEKAARLARIQHLQTIIPTPSPDATPAENAAYKQALVGDPQDGNRGAGGAKHLDQ